MAPKIVTPVRLDPDLRTWLDGYAAGRGVDRTAVVTAALEAVRSGTFGELHVERSPDPFPGTGEEEPYLPRVCLDPRSP
jgi:hypothetical protein